MTDIINNENIATTNVLKKDKSLTLVKLFSIIFLVLNFGVGFFNVILNIVFDAVNGYSVLVDFKYYLRDLFDVFLVGLPIIVLLVYIFVFFTKKAGNWLLAVSFGTMGLASFIFVINSFSNFVGNIKFNVEYFEYFSLLNILHIYGWPLLSILFNLTVICFAAFYIVDCFLKFKFAKITRIVFALHFGLALYLINNI